MGRAFQIVVLPAAQRPEKGREREPAEEQADRDQIDQNIHQFSPMRDKRKALAITKIEDADIERAAISGVT